MTYLCLVQYLFSKLFHVTQFFDMSLTENLSKLGTALSMIVKQDFLQQKLQYQQFIRQDSTVRSKERRLTSIISCNLVSNVKKTSQTSPIQVLVEEKVLDQEIYIKQQQNLNQKNQIITIILNYIHPSHQLIQVEVIK